MAAILIEDLWSLSSCLLPVFACPADFIELKTERRGWGGGGPAEDKSFTSLFRSSCSHIQQHYGMSGVCVWR